LHTEIHIPIPTQEFIKGSKNIIHEKLFFKENVTSGFEPCDIIYFSNTFSDSNPIVLIKDVKGKFKSVDFPPIFFSYSKEGSADYNPVMKIITLQHREVGSLVSVEIQGRIFQAVIGSRSTFVYSYVEKRLEISYEVIDQLSGESMGRFSEINFFPAS